VGIVDKIVYPREMYSRMRVLRATMTASGPLNGLLRHLGRAALRGGPELADADLLGRWLSLRDESAFEALVWRHGPMVLGVCRRVLGNAADAEDAFQATFLVLVRKAASVVPRSRVGSWLHGVAHRTALKALEMNSRRRKREQVARQQPAADAPRDEEELLARLDEELGRLPEKYRVPIVLCHLEGRAVQEAARELGLPQGTLASRLARGRALLARRLGRGEAAIPAASALPASLVSGTVKAALLTEAGVAAGVPAKALLLSERVLKSMLLAKLTTGSSLLLLAALIATVGAMASAVPREGQSEAAAAGVGFVQMLDNAAKARTMTARMTVNPGLGEKVNRLYVSGRRTRYEVVNTGWQGAPPREKVPVIAASVSDPETGRSLGLHFAERTYSTTVLPGMGQAPDLVGQMRRVKDGAVRLLGDDVVGGEKARGYAVRIDGLAGVTPGVAEVWVSLRTGLPVQIRAVRKYDRGRSPVTVLDELAWFMTGMPSPAALEWRRDVVTVYDEFAWDVPLLDDLFRMTPPEGFKEVPFRWTGPRRQGPPEGPPSR
jgi:RNA polymerase sigma factor (sigma-70 family)